MSELAIYGAGGLGRELLLMIAQINAVKPSWTVRGFFDDHLPRGSRVDGLEVLGGIHEVNDHKDKLAVILAIADPQTRMDLRQKIKNSKINFPFIAHPHANLGSEHNRFLGGTIITEGVICTTGISIGEFVIVNLACTIGHDVEIDGFTTVMPGCHISGNVHIGTAVLLGSGATILQNLEIGDGSKIGAGAVVTKNIAKGITAVGIPASPKS